MYKKHSMEQSFQMDKKSYESAPRGVQQAAALWTAQDGSQADFVDEYARIYKLGRLTPIQWMIEAVGEAPSIEPILRAVDTLCGATQKQ